MRIRNQKQTECRLESETLGELWRKIIKKTAERNCQDSNRLILIIVHMCQLSAFLILRLVSPRARGLNKCSLYINILFVVILHPNISILDLIWIQERDASQEKQWQNGHWKHTLVKANIFPRTSPEPIFVNLLRSPKIQPGRIDSWAQ